MGKCWICACEDTREWLPFSLRTDVSSSDLKATDSRYGVTLRIVKCVQCGFRFADPLPAGGMTGLYEHVVDEEYETEKIGRQANFRKIFVKALQLNSQIKTVLDIGAGTGLLCQVAEAMNMHAVGIEPSYWAVRQGRVKHGVDLIRGVYPHPQLEGRQFDLITLVDVIEHIDGPVQLLASLVEAMHPDSLLAIVTPDVGSFPARVLGRRWWHYRPAHIGYFDDHTMRYALRRAGLELQDKEPYVWTFTIDYLSHRVSQYVPLGWLWKVAKRLPMVRRLYDIPVDLNLRDSVIYYAKKTV